MAIDAAAITASYASTQRNTMSVRRNQSSPTLDIVVLRIPRYRDSTRRLDTLTASRYRFPDVFALTKRPSRFRFVYRSVDLPAVDFFRLILQNYGSSRVL